MENNENKSPKKGFFDGLSANYIISLMSFGTGYMMYKNGSEWWAVVIGIFIVAIIGYGFKLLYVFLDKHIK